MFTPRLPFALRFNAAGQAGPRRLLIIAATGLLMVGLVAGVSLIRPETPPPSRVARMPPINRLPGGLDSNPQQDALLRTASQEHAKTALDKGQSYTPPLAASVAVAPPPETSAAAAPAVAPAVARPASAAPIARPVVVAAASTTPPATSGPAIDPKAEQEYRAVITQLFAGWDGRSPRTDVVLTPETATGTPIGQGASRAKDELAAGAARPVAGASPAPAQKAQGRLLVPGGRGVFAHTVLAVSSDSGGPIVLQADSGPIAGDRMIGGFSKQADRLVVNVNTLIHQGRTIEVKGLVIAPESMETAVATSVDQHYLSRFLLPAAAAFVQGLGQAIAQSNTTSVLSPLGGVTAVNHLDFSQETGIAAGVAAAQVGAALREQAPKGPTVNLAANASVGVMFLDDVTAAP